MNNHTRNATETIYTCPMHPEVIKTAPGKCPGCGMDLIPVSTRTPEVLQYSKLPFTLGWLLAGYFLAVVIHFGHNIVFVGQYFEPATVAWRLQLFAYLVAMTTFDVFGLRLWQKNRSRGALILFITYGLLGLPSAMHYIDHNPTHFSAFVNVSISLEVSLAFALVVYSLYLLSKKQLLNNNTYQHHNESNNHDTQAMDQMDHEAAMTNPAMAKQMEADMRRRFWISLVLSIPIFLYSPVGKSLGVHLYSPLPINWLLLILTTPIVFWTGSIFITGTYYSLKAKKLNMAVLIATGVLAAYLFSVLLTLIGSEESFYEAAALLVTFVLFGHWMEMRSRKGTSESLQALFNLVPPQATVIRDGNEIAIPSANIIKGDIVVLRPGDKVAVDGEITEGQTSIDESLVTGESIPVAKAQNDRVVGGSVNLTGMVKFRATEVGADTVLAQIIAMVETAQNSKAPGQRIADRWAGRLVIVAIGSGLITFFAWYFGGNVSVLTALTFAISAVVIACPDALGLATPTAVAVGTGIGARHNILIKDAATLENTSRLTAIVLDKTGTLTEGKPKVTDIVSFNGFADNEVLELSASLGAASNHPISKAIVSGADAKKLTLKSVTNFESIAGYGIKGNIGGKLVYSGNEKLLVANTIDTSAQRTAIDTLASQGKTLSLLAVNDKLAGVVAVSDTIKPTAKQTIRALQALGLEVAMITGDHTKVAEAVGTELGIERIFAEVLPGDKATHVKKLQDEGKFVAMVGDGINDAPALAGADIGIAIGAGTDVAIETASIVLMKSDPYDIVRAITLSKATVTKMKQNLFWAAIYNLLAIPVAAGVFYPSFGILLRPEISALLMSASSIIVATNAVLLKRVESQLKI